MTRVATGPKRNEASRIAILEATFALLEEVGFDRLSIEGVAARAGVGKATIYRWWPTKGVLAVEAFLTTVISAIDFPETSSAKADILMQMRALAALYRGATGRFVREMIGASQSDPDMRRAFFEGFLAPRRAAALKVFRRGIEGGEFRAGLDAEMAIDALYSPIYYRLLISDGPIDDSRIDALADMVLNGLAV